MHNAPCFQHLLSKVTARLLEAFSDLVKVMRDAALQTALLQLPFNALVILLNRCDHEKNAEVAADLLLLLSNQLAKLGGR